MKWSVGTKISIGFGLIVAIFIIVGIISYQSTSQLVVTSNLRQQTYDVMRRLAELDSLATDVQNSIRGYAITGQDREFESYQIAVKSLEETIEDIRNFTANHLRQQQRLDALESLIKSRLDFHKEVVTAIRSDSLETGIELIKTDRGAMLSIKIKKIIDEMTIDVQALLLQRVEIAERSAESTKQIILFSTFVALLFAVLSGFVITRNIARPLQYLTTIAQRITVGDLSVKVLTDERSDEVGELARTFEHMTQSLRTMADAAKKIANGDLRTIIQPQSPEDILGNAFARMAESLREQIRELLDGANVLGSAASEIVASTTQLSASASESAVAVNETTTTVEEVRQTAQMASQKAKQVSDSVQQVAQSSQNGTKSIADVSKGMENISQQMDAIASSMVRLSEQNQAIGQIIASVEDLATQSNLLAVNASIEAAKAGEHGKGFSVVAQEVKSLAEQSRQATNQVRTILGDIQKATTTAVMATEQGSKAVEIGVHQSEVAGESIQMLAGSVMDSAHAATQIAASSQEQLVGVDQVTVAMDSIKLASSQNVASAQQLETAARNLSDLGQRLKQMVGRYQV